MTDKAYKSHFDKLAKLKEHIGKEVGLSEWVTIEQDRVNSFAATTEDNQWIHVNPEMAKSFSPYKAPIAHGFLVLSLAPKFSYECISIGDTVMGVNYGCDRVRFPNATKVGAKVRGRLKLLEYKELPNGAQYKTEITFELEGQEKPACVAEMIAQAYVGPEEQAENVRKLNQMADAQAAALTTNKDEPNNDVLYEVQDNIAIITLNRPDRYNGITKSLLDGLFKKMMQARDDDKVRAVVLAGNGKGFCAGADLGDFSKGGTGKDITNFLNTYYRTSLEMQLSIKKPVIAAIQGAAAGAGTGFALACDLRVMEKSASYAFVFSNIGLNTDNGAGWLLQRQVGYSKAFEYTIEGSKIPAEECLAVGLANKVVEDGYALTTAIEWAKRLAQKAPLAIASQKEILLHATSNSLMDTFAIESRNQGILIDSADHKEGVQAFMEKRKADFKGA